MLNGIMLRTLGICANELFNNLIHVVQNNKIAIVRRESHVVAV